MTEIRWFENIMKVEVEEDIVHVVGYGEISLYALADYFSMLEEIQARQGSLYVISCLAHARKIPSQPVRAMTAQWTAKNLVKGVAMYGVDPVLRVLAGLVFNAANLLRRGSAVVHFAVDEAGARQWVAQLKAKQSAQ